MFPSTMTSTLSNPSKKIFVDTSAFLALLNSEDQFHSWAKAQWRSLLENAFLLVTNNYVVVESMTILQNRHGLELVQNLQNALLPSIEIEWLDEEQHNLSVYNLFTANRCRLSLVDCSAFTTMRRLGIREVFTFDEHFAEQGFEVVPVIGG